MRRRRSGGLVEQRAQRREAARNLAFSKDSLSSSGCTPAKDDETAVSANDDEAVVEEHPLLVAQVGEQLETKYQLHELPTDDSLTTATSTASLFMLFYRLELVGHRSGTMQASDFVVAQPGPSRL